MNEDIFRSVSSPKVAYWLGFLAADGSVHKSRNQLEIGLSIKDRQHLEIFKNFLEGKDLSILDREVKCKGKKLQASFLFVTSERIKNDLAQYFIVPNKSHLNNDFLENIPEQYKMFFIFGLFDGDGWFCDTETSKNFGICGTEKVINSVVNYLNDYYNWNLHSNFYKKSPNTYYFQTSSIPKILQFTEDYLKSSEKCDLLERKKKVANDLNQYCYNKINEKNKIEKREKERKKVVCPVCKNSFIPERGQKYCCKECMHYGQRKVIRPSREELKILLRKENFVQIGKNYGVSDNAVRKWCAYYDLPYRIKDIKKISDQDWENI